MAYRSELDENLIKEYWPLVDAEEAPKMHAFTNASAAACMQLISDSFLDNMSTKRNLKDKLNL